MADPITLEDILDRPIAFHRAFVTLTGSITAALMLSQAMYWRKRTKDEGRWFYKSRDEWEEETGMTRREQETARKKLLNCGVWEEWRDRINHRIYFRVKIEALWVMAESALTQCRNPPLPNGGKRPSSNGSEITAENTNKSVDFKAKEQTLKTSPQKPPKHFAAPLPELPEDMADLADDWRRWVEHCLEIKKPLTPISAKEQFALMDTMSDTEVREAMGAAMRSRWPAFYPPRKTPAPAQRTEPPGVTL